MVETGAILRLIAMGVGKSWPMLVCSTVLATVSVAAQLWIVWIIWHLVDALIAQTATAEMFWWHAFYALVAVVGYTVCFGVSMAASHRLAFDGILNIRVLMIRHMARISMGYFTDMSSGAAKNLIVDEPEKMEGLIAHAIPEGTSAFANWIAVSIWLFAVDWRMAVAAIVTVPLAVAAMAFGVSRGAVLTLRYKSAVVGLNAQIAEYLAGMAVIRIFDRDGARLTKVGSAVDEMADAQSAWALRYLPFGGMAVPLAMSSVFVIAVAGVWLMALADLTMAAFMFFIILGANYSRPLIKLFGLLHELSHTALGAKAMLNLMSTPVQYDSGARVALHGFDIRFRDVDFAYDAQTPVLKRLNFDIAQNRMTAIVGQSGAGKSAIAGLLARVYDTTGGTITVGGRDIRDIGIDQLMETVDVLYQHTFLFSGTIRTNLQMARHDASVAEMADACRHAQIHDAIMAMPDGYDTRIGDGGRALSGGERQRIAIARAILKNAPVLVLDEATAFVDMETEAAIQDAITTLMTGRTLIVIAHRLHTIRHADRILVMAHGRLVENGTHEELLHGDGRYARLWADYGAKTDIAS